MADKGPLAKILGPIEKEVGGWESEDLRMFERADERRRRSTVVSTEGPSKIEECTDERRRPLLSFRMVTP